MSDDSNHYIIFQASISRVNIVHLIDAIESKNSKNVVLLIHTGGGNSAEPFHFYNYIKARSINLTTYNMSIVASAGIDMFLCGENRICSPLSMFMFHESIISAGAITIRQMEDWISKQKVAEEVQSNFLIDRCGKNNLSTLREWRSKDTNVSPQQALAVSLCTRIEHINIPENAILDKIQSKDFGES